jgi:hypothetical protein
VTPIRSKLKIDLVPSAVELSVLLPHAYETDETIVPLHRLVEEMKRGLGLSESE